MHGNEEKRMVKVEDFFLMKTISTTWRVFTDTSNLLRLRQSNNLYTKEVEVYIGLMYVSVLDILITTFPT
jgi:hypothetical protein